mmetsp:Transcript_9983/g.38823  ORF Transcript_9983/g.38823 Transcript_9983/m.38823 type:complete len:220 (+) Transcript_9983:342-1001(+)
MGNSASASASAPGSAPSATAFRPAAADESRPCPEPIIETSPQRRDLPPRPADCRERSALPPMKPRCPWPLSPTPTPPAPAPAPAPPPSSSLSPSAVSTSSAVSSITWSISPERLPIRKDRAERAGETADAAIRCLEALPSPGLPLGGRLDGSPGDCSCTWRNLRMAAGDAVARRRSDGERCSGDGPGETAALFCPRGSADHGPALPGTSAGFASTDTSP